MNQYIGLDVSMKETAISIRQDGKRIWRGKCASDPQLLAAVIRKRAPDAQRVVFQTGPLSVWFYHALTSEGFATPSGISNPSPKPGRALPAFLLRAAT